MMAWIGRVGMIVFLQIDISNSDNRFGMEFSYSLDIRRVTRETYIANFVILVNKT